MTTSATAKSRISLNIGTKSAAIQASMSKNKKFIIGAGLVLLLLGGLIIAAKPEPGAKNPPKTATPASGKLATNEMNFDFGSISMAAGKVTHRFRIRNASATPIVIGKLYTSCMCTTAALVKGGRKFDPQGMPGHGFIPTINESMSPNEEAMIEVVFDPGAHGPAGIGPIERIVTVEHSAGQPLELAFSALVRP